MNVTLWILQVLLALHMVIGAGWKFSNSAEQTAPSLRAIPSTVWRGLIVAELLAAVALVLPAASRSLAILAPIGAALITAEMMLFVGIHLGSRSRQHSQMVYWLVAAALSVFVAFGRFVLEPL